MWITCKCGDKTQTAQDVVAKGGFLTNDGGPPGDTLSIVSEYMATGRKKEGRYTPPRDVGVASVRALLEGTHRQPQGPKQLSMLSALNSSHASDDLMVFTAGDLSLLKKPCVSVIGTREVSAEGVKRARRVAKELVQRGVVVVSGLADGVDTEAMTTAIAIGGHTIGVIGTPLSKAYPAKNAALQEEIYRDHLLVSQFEEGTRTFKSSFPQRNRLMAFLSDASVIIEASDTSGTLHQQLNATPGPLVVIAKSVAEIQA